LKRKIIDGHVHIVPAHLLGKTDPRFNVAIEPHGIKRFSDGSVYQFMPEHFYDSCYSVEGLNKSMDEMGIEKAVIMQSPCFILNEEVIQAVKKYPERLKGAMIIEPSGEICLNDIENWHSRGLTVMKFEMSAGLGYTHPNMFPDLEFDSPLFKKIWVKATELFSQNGIVVHRIRLFIGLDERFTRRARCCSLGICDACNRGQELLPNFRFKGAHGKLELSFVGDDVVLGTGLNMSYGHYSDFPRR
jgi:hypothetical protein